MENIIDRALADCQAALEDLRRNSVTREALVSAAGTMVEAFAAGNRLYSCGNGGSMCDAMHLAEELTGRFRGDRRALAATAISDPGHISCVSNDYGYDQVFSRFIEAFGSRGDILFAISTSGQSANCLRAAEVAKDLGLTVITLTGRPSSPLGDLADVDICTPAPTKWADRVQELHIKCIHILIELCESTIKP